MLIFAALIPQLAQANCFDANGKSHKAGGVIYNVDFKVLQYCDGTVWHAMAGAVPGGGSGGDLTPDAFSFTDQTNVTPSTLTTSNTIIITGLGQPTNVTITGVSTPQFRIAGGAWGTTGTISNGETLELRLTSNAANSTMNSVTITVGTESDQWDVTTVGQDTTPVAFNFTDQTGVALSTLTPSNSLAITGITGSVAVTISGAGSPQFRIAGGAWGTTGNINNGQTLELRLTSNAAFSTMNSTTVTVGTESDQWDVTTVGQDTTPVAFNFTDQTGVALSTLTASNSLAITGITGSVAVTISGAGSPQFRIAGGAWGTTGNINNGQTLELHLTSNAAGGTMNSATVTVGTGSDQWDVTTAISCSGFVYNGRCYYAGALNTSCDTTCSTHGGCNQPATDYALSTTAICQDLVLNFYPTASVPPSLNAEGLNLGCYRNAFIGTNLAAIDTTNSACSGGVFWGNRMCGCNN